MTTASTRTYCKRLAKNVKVAVSPVDKKRKVVLALKRQWTLVVITQNND